MTEETIRRGKPADSKTRILVEGALMVAISAVLCNFPKFKFLLNGGSITVCSMLPIILFSYRRGLKWGFGASLVFAGIQMLGGITPPSSPTPKLMAIVVIFDYLLAFSIIGIGGVFRGRLGSVKKELVLGSLLALSLRFLSHFISGYLIWGEYAEWFFSSLGSVGQWVLDHSAGKPLMLLYSFVYNGSYMIPEIILTCIVAGILAPVALSSLEDGPENG